MANDAEISQYIDALLTTADQAEQMRSVRSLCALGVELNGGWGPRGTLADTAEVRGPVNKNTEGALLALWSSTAEELRDRFTGLLGLWGGPTSAKFLRAVIEATSDERLLTYCCRALGMLGGRDAVTGLLVTAIKVSGAVRSTAIAQLKELAVGGSEDLTQPAFMSNIHWRNVFSICDFEAVVSAIGSRTGSLSEMSRRFGRLRELLPTTHELPFCDNQVMSEERWLPQALSVPYDEATHDSASLAMSQFVGSARDQEDVVLSVLHPASEEFASWLGGAMQYVAIRTLASFISLDYNRTMPSTQNLVRRVVADQTHIREACMAVRNVAIVGEFWANPFEQYSAAKCLHLIAPVRGLVNAE